MTEQFNAAAGDAAVDLWAPLLDAARGAITVVGVALVFFLGVWMLSVAAPGKMGDISRWLIAILVGKVARRLLGSFLLIASGIAAELHFGPLLFIAPQRAGLGVVVGIAAIVGGMHVLTRNPRKGPRRVLLMMTAIVTTVLVSGCAIGNAVGEVTG